MREAKIFPAELGRSGWFESSPLKSHRFNTHEEIEDEYDFVIIGAGFGGCGAAWRFTETNPGAKVAVFEAIRIGNNDSGKNGGFMIDTPHAFGRTDFTTEDQIRIVQINKYAIDTVSRIVREHNLKVDFDPCGKFLCAHEPGALKYLDLDAKEFEATNCEYRFLDKDEVASKLGTDYYIRGIYNPGSVMINPADVVRGLFTALPSNVKVFEETPVLCIEEGPTPTVILRNGRRIRCKAIVLTVGQFLKQFGFIRNQIFPAISFGAISRELTEKELSIFKDVPPWGLTSAHPAGTTVRFTHANRIVVRNGLKFGTWPSCSPHRIDVSQKLLRKAFNNRFPSLTHVNFECVWAGCIHLSLNGRNAFGRHGDIYYASMGEGTGVCRGFTMGAHQVDAINGIKSDILTYMQNDKKPSWCPPEPFQTIGAECRMVFEAAMARDEI